MTDTDTFDHIRANAGTVVPVSDEFADYCLEVVPPYYGKGFFGMGEPYSHEDDEPVTTWILCRHGKHYATHGTQASAQRVFMEFLSGAPGNEAMR